MGLIIDTRQSTTVLTATAGGRMRIYCDESGNTGTALFDKDQPVFSLASTSLTRDVAQTLLRPLLRQGQREAKYAKLKGTATGQRELVRFFSSPELNLASCKVTLVDKKFYLISHIVDKLIEPCMHQDGVDLYEGDAHVGLTNVWYYTGFTIFTNGYWDRILEAFLRAIRRKDGDSFAFFDKVLDAAISHISYGSADYAAGILVSKGRLKEFIGIYNDIEALDPACDAFMSLMQTWMKETPDYCDVLHDRSKPMRRNEPFLKALMKPAKSRQIGFSHRSGELPLRIAEFEFVDSAQHPSIQLADLISGAAIDCLLTWSGKKPTSDYHEALKETKLPELFAGGMLPDYNTILEKAPESKRGEKNIVEGATAFLAETGYFDSVP